MKSLTSSQAHYIKAAFELSSESCDGSVRVVNIADKLGVSKASASLAMSKLTKEKPVRKDERRQVYLTPAEQ
jgi:Mn-dependent DtxR family transcriptional regulator